MRATAVEFRLRMAIMVAIIALGFWSPWIEGWGLGRRISLLEWLALEISRVGLAGFGVATIMVIVLGILIAAAGAWLRVWGTAWLGTGIVTHRRMQAGAVMANGPYRYVRNPLYLGSDLTFLATALLMPVTGAVFAMILLSLFLFRLILAEESFLKGRLGPAYATYLNAVPRIFPRLRTSLPTTGQRPQWIRGVLAELYPIGVVVTLAVFSWRYDTLLMLKAILVCFGLSLVSRAFVPQDPKEPSAGEIEGDA